MMVHMALALCAFLLFKYFESVMRRKVATKTLSVFSFNNFGGDGVGGLGCGKEKFIIRTLAAVNGFRVGEI